jgi:signal transduction histidine kinase
MSRDVSLVDLIVHEMRTPLTVALGSLRHAETSAPAEAEAALARARRSCEQLERLAAQMRDFVRVVAMPQTALTAVSLGETLASAVARVRAERDLAVTTSSLPDGRDVIALAPQLETAMTSVLMALARAASPSEGLEISATGSETVLKVVARRESAPADSAADTFDAEWLGGLGFGLPLARAVIERGGGTIRSAPAADGRLGVISVTLVAASTPPPA